MRNKNIQQLHGRPLLDYAIECARQCPEIGHIVVSTDSDEIAAVAEESTPPDMATTTRAPASRPPMAAAT